MAVDRVGYWHDANCESQNSYLCEINRSKPATTASLAPTTTTTITTVTPAPTEPVGLTCPPGFYTTERRCFRLEKSRSTYAIARYNCKLFGSEIAVIRNAADQDRITEYVAISGILGNEFSDWAYIGLSRPRSGDPWIWLDGSLSHYFNWYRGMLCIVETMY